VTAALTAPSLFASPAIAAPVHQPAPAVTVVTKRDAAARRSQRLAAAARAVSRGRTAKALSFARAQVGKPYRYGATGPGSYDCSGLVQASYNHAGIATGPHNVVAQYNYFKNRGRLVPLSHRQPGDILFYSFNGRPSGGYHDSIYTGGGTMVEAANIRVGVIKRRIWLPGQLLPYVARPAA